MAPSVIIADDSAIVRAGVAQMLTGEGGISVDAVVADVDALRRVMAERRPDVAVIDIRMPPTCTDEGLRAAEWIRRHYPDTGVLILSQYVEAAYARELLEVGHARIGYLLKDCVIDGSALVAAVWRVHAGEVVMDPALIRALMPAACDSSRLACLSRRELEVLALMAEGLTDRGIADRLVLSTKTVGTHVQHIFRRLDLRGTPSDNRRVLAVLSYLDETT
ncbi:MAG TPA: response regulator transcription factor [Kineosporiaceae bacterium]